MSDDNDNDDPSKTEIRSLEMEMEMTMGAMEAVRGAVEHPGIAHNMVAMKVNWVERAIKRGKGAALYNVIS
jgi:hypothetical protein